jgi:hypothetical protein
MKIYVANDTLQLDIRVKLCNKIQVIILTQILPFFSGDAVLGHLYMYLYSFNLKFAPPTTFNSFLYVFVLI